MGNFFSVLYLLAYLWAGWGLARRTLPENGPEHTVVLGCAFGVAMLAMVPAALALALGFVLPAALAALALVLAAGAWAWHGAPGRPAARTKKKAAAARSKPKTPAADAAGARTDAVSLLCCCAPALVLTVYLLYTHVLCYDPRSGAYYTGQSGYGDIAMHLAFIKSIAVAGEMPPHYSLLAGQELLGYPFLCESVSSVFLLLGAGLKFAYILPEIPALAGVFGGVWLLARQALGRAGKANLAFVLFVLGGGFGFASCFGFGAFACLLYLVGYGLVYLAVEVGELALLLADLLAETFLALFEAFDLFLFGYLLLVELLALVHDFADEHDHASLGFEIFVLGLHEFALFLHDLLCHVVLVGGVLACVACAAIHLGEVACAEYEDDGGLDFGGLTGYA